MESATARAVEVGCKNLGFKKFLLQKKTKKTQKSKF